MKSFTEQLNILYERLNKRFIFILSFKNLSYSYICTMYTNLPTGFKLGETPEFKNVNTTVRFRDTAVFMQGELKSVKAIKKSYFDSFSIKYLKVTSL